MAMVAIIVAATSIPVYAGPVHWPWQKKKKNEKVMPKKSEYDKLLGKKHETAMGIFTLHSLDGKLYFEIPLRLLGRDMLLGSTVTSVSDNGNAIVGSKPQDPLHVRFTMDKARTHIQLRLVDYDYIATESAIDQALLKNNEGEIVDNEKILAWNKDSTQAVVDMTSFFVGDNDRLSPFDKGSLYAQKYKRSQTFKSDLSYLSGIKAFSDNVSVKSVLTYNYTLSSQGKNVVKDQPFTAEMTRSLMLLKEKPYKPRYADNRIGFFYTKRQQLGDASATSLPVYYANRWNLQPADTAAWLRGETVEVKHPVVFYVDNTFPANWRPSIKEAITQWSEVFEKECRLKNAVVARDFPTAEEDPEFDPDNIKYNCVRYAPINIENAMGPSWVDPRSGEILMASVYVYHDFIKLLSRWLFVQTAAADPAVRTLDIPDSIMHDAIRYVISHEVGHCLGLMHNWGASHNFPVEKLRDPAFTQHYGTTPSIMDYARFNYIAQPGDKERGVRLTPPRFGIYDHYAIKWGYLPIFGKTEKEEAQYLHQWITDSLKANPWYRYGKQQMTMPCRDPRSQMEDLGDNAVAATKYGVKNLKYIVAHMNDWLSGHDPDMTKRKEMISGVVNQMALYALHVASNVAGIYENEVRDGDGQQRFVPMRKADQIGALRYLFTMYNDLHWLDNRVLLQQVPMANTPANSVANYIARLIVSVPYNVASTSGMFPSTLKFDEAMGMVDRMVWHPSLAGKTLTDRQMSLQKKYVYSLMQNSGFKTPSSHISSLTADPVAGFGFDDRNMFGHGNLTQADIYPYLMNARRTLKKVLGKAKGRTRGHYELLLKTIDTNCKITMP